MKRYLTLIITLSCTLCLSAQEKDSSNTEEEAVKTVVERFLIAAGNYDLDSMPEMFTEKANIGGASFRNGQWKTFTMTFTEFLDMLKSSTNPKKFVEPVYKFTVHIDGGMLAFVKGDAIVYRNDIPQSNNFDYFTLIKENDEWKILNGSYVSIPIEN